MFKFTNILIGLFMPCFLFAQKIEPKLSIKELVILSENNYPAIKAKQAQLQARETHIQVIKNSFFPSLDAGVQANLATHNNISGMSLPQFLLPISGPPSSGNSFSPVFGSAASLLFNWQAVTFGQRNALNNEGESLVNVQKADLNNAIFQHKVKLIEGYLDWVIAADLIKLAQRNLERNTFNLTQSQTLVNSGIRPGADTSLFSSEVSKSIIEVLQMQQYKINKSLQLVELSNTDTAKILYDSSFLTSRINYTVAVDSVTHPVLALSKSYIDLANAQKESIQRSANPKLTVWGTAFARGSGVDYNGNVNATKGLLVSRYNYGAGVQLSVPLLKFRDVRLQSKEQEFIIQADKENFSQAELEIGRQSKIAESALFNAIAIANETPRQLQSAQESYNALFSRYKAGLIDFSNLMQAQYNLSKAETDAKKSRLDVWKALLYKAAVSGDLNIFLNQLK